MKKMLFMPWCPIDKEYNVGNITILPYTPNSSFEGLTDSQCNYFHSIMGIYRDIRGNPIKSASIIRYKSKSIIDEFSDDEIDDMVDFLEIGCFAALIIRDFFGQSGVYCNSDCFSLRIQEIKGSNIIGLWSRRRAGHQIDGWLINDVSITVPVHCNSVNKVSLDSSIISALVEYRSVVDIKEWTKWQNAISFFNLANTDNGNFRYQIEWILICNAFERILDAKANAKDVASKFSQIFIPSEELSLKDIRRFSKQNGRKTNSVRYEWMYDFYRIRGDFAHGKVISQQTTLWNHLEHLVLATIAFPLLVKVLLFEAHGYQLSDEDRIAIDSFEEFAGTPDFLSPRKVKGGNQNSVWNQVRINRMWRNAKIALRDSLRQPINSPNSNK